MTAPRPARMSEIAALNELIASSARVLSVGWYTEAQIHSLVTHVFGVDTQLVRDGTYFVIEREQTLVACGGWSARRTLFGGDQAKAASDSRLDPMLDPLVDVARIRAFFVHPGAARLGFGRQLLLHCEDAAVVAGFSRTELMATLPGEPFYRAHGYQTVERIAHHLADGQTVELVRMGKSLR